MKKSFIIKLAQLFGQNCDEIVNTIITFKLRLIADFIQYMFSATYRLPVINNYSPKWRYLVVDIYRAAKLIITC